jgi:hypothetical protein
MDMDMDPSLEVTTTDPGLSWDMIYIPPSHHPIYAMPPKLSTHS